MNNLIEISDNLRLRKFQVDDQLDQALTWYQDEKMVYLVDGVRLPYSLEKLQRMYTYLNQHGELYWIEALEENAWHVIGDVTLSQTDLPIVIGDNCYRGRGIGQQVVRTLIAVAKERNWSELRVREIYRWNQASQACFCACGFEKVAETPLGASYRLDLLAK